MKTLDEIIRKTKPTKTLDELIHSLGYCSDLANSVCSECAYRDVKLCRLEKDTDALYYLKEYRNCGACAYADSYLRCTKEDRNDPLSWEQLKQMKGKPVWVEALLYKQWAVIAYVGDDHIRFEGVNLYAPESRIYMGAEDGWQAYRKERNVD